MELGLATFADVSAGVSAEQRMRDLMEEVKLADELYDLRCEISLCEYGEHGDRLLERMRRFAELEPLVGDEFDRR